MKKRIVPFLLVLMVSCLFWTFSRAQAAAVDDQAAVIDVNLAGEITALSKLSEDNLGIGLRVLTKHFLGGADIRTYAEKTLSEKPGNESLVLLAVIIGEESYHAALGSRTEEMLGREKVENLLTGHFRQPFIRDRAYDRALASFFLALSEHIQSAVGKELPANRLLLDYAERTAVKPAVTSAPASPVSWLEGILSDAENSVRNADRYVQETRQAEEGSGKGMSWFQIALIGFILYKVFGRKRGGKKGCGPFSWILGTWGVSKIFGWRK